MTAVRAAVHQTFSSLRIRNYRLYFTAQLISVSGTWMQTVAQAWLVLHLTGSGVALGIVVGLQFLPMLLFGPFGGLVADRMNKRSLLYATQTAGGLLALALGLLVVTDAVQLWQVYLLAALLGVVNVFDNPARQTFVMEMVGRDDLPNAVSLNTVVMNASRVVGPAIGGLVITLVGLGACFFINAASYIAVIVGLSMMRSAELHPTVPVERAKGQIREGLRLRLAHARPPQHPPGHRPHRHLRLQLHRDPGPAGQGDLPRRGRYLLAAHLVHGHRGGGRWADRRPPGPAHPPAAAGAGPGVRRAAGRRGPGADAGSPPRCSSCSWARRRSGSSPRPTPRSS